MAKQTTDVKIRLLIEGFEGLDKIKGSFRELGKVTNLSEKDLNSARESLLDIAKQAGNTERANKGLTEALKGLLSEASRGSSVWNQLNKDLLQVQQQGRRTEGELDRIRAAVVAEASAHQQSSSSIRSHIKALEDLRAQAVLGGQVSRQLSNNIDTLTQRLNQGEVSSRKFRSSLTAILAVSPDAVLRQWQNYRQVLQDASSSAEDLALAQERLNKLAGAPRITARRAITARAAIQEDPEYLKRFGLEGRSLEAMPDTTAALSQRLRELQDDLSNTVRNTQIYLNTTLATAAVQREASAATQGLGAALRAQLDAGTLIPSQKNLQEVIGQLRREMIELDQTTAEGSRTYAQNAAEVVRLEQQLNRLSQAYRTVSESSRTATQQGINPFTAAGGRNPAYTEQQRTELESLMRQAEQGNLEAIDSLLSAKRTMYEYEASRSAQLDGQKDQEAQKEIARTNEQMRKDTEAFEQERKRLNILTQQRIASRKALGFAEQQDLSPLYQSIVGLGTAGVERQQQFMGRSAADVLNDIATSFSKGGRTVDLKQRSTEIGDSVAEGVAQGATDSAATTTGAKTFADKLITAYKAAFKIKSPSGESKEKIGVPIGQGIGLGIIEGLKGFKTQVQLAISDVIATPGRAPLPGAMGPVSDVADKLQAFLARSSAKTSTFLPLTRLLGEGATSSAALPLAVYRRNYERGGIVSPSFLPAEQRRGLRGTAGIPGAGLEEIIRAEAFRAVSRTGAFVGPLSGPRTVAGTIPSLLRPGISMGGAQPYGTSAAQLPLFRPSTQLAPPQSTLPGTVYRMGGVPSAFPAEGPLGRSQTFGRAAASTSVRESVSAYRKAIDNFWNGETSSFETIRRVVSSGAQLSASKLARNLSETRNTTAALSTAAVQLASAPGIAFTKLGAAVRTELSELKSDLKYGIQEVTSDAQRLRQSVAGAAGTVRNAFSPLLAGRTQPTVYGSALPPVPPVPPGAGGGGPSPAANNEFTKLNATLTTFSALNRRSVNDIQALGSALQQFKGDLAPVDAGYKQINKRIEEQERLIERELRTRQRRQIRPPSTGQLVQAGGAAISGGIFGGPEGFLGGIGGAALGSFLPGIGTAGGAFAGAAAGAQVGMFRQQLAGTADYAASIGKLQIALRGVVGSQAAYDQAIRAAAAATRDLNIPQEEATRGLTRLSAAVIGAGGTVADSSFAFRSMSEAIKATGGNAEQVDGALLALTQVFSKGKVSAEELNQIAERLPGTFTLFAQAAGKTGPELQKALEQGQVGLNDLMKFLALTSQRYGTTALEIASSSQDAGARLTVAFQAMRLEVGKALQPLGAELQNSFANFIKDITPAVVGSIKTIADVLKFFITNETASGLAKFALNMGLVTTSLVAMKAAASGIVALNIASWFTGAATGAKITGDAAVISAGKVGMFRTAALGLFGVLKSIAAIGIITASVNIVVNNLGRLLAAKDAIDKLKKERDVTGETGPRLVMTAERRYTGASREKVTADVNKQVDLLLEYNKQLRNSEKRLANLRLATSNPLYLAPLEAEKELLELRIKSAQDVVNLDLNRFQTQKQIDKQRAADLEKRFASPAGDEKGAKSAAAKEKRLAETQVADQQRLNETLMQQQIRFADAVFEHQRNLDRQRFDLLQEFTDLEAQNRINKLVGPQREVAAIEEQRRQRSIQFENRIRAARVDLATAQQKLSGAQQMATVTTSAGLPSGTGFSTAQLQSASREANKFTGIANMCSEAVKAFYKSLGVTLPGVTSWADTVRNAGKVMTDWSKLKAGDIVATGKPGNTPHVGVYTGGQNVFHQSRNRGLRAGNYPDLDYFKSGYFVRPDAMANAPTGAAGRQATGVAAQQRRGAVDTGDVALAQQNVQQAQALLDNLLSFQEKAQTLFGDEQITALTAGFTSQNYELEKTIQLETQRFDLMRKGYSDERIAVEQKIAQAQIERDARLVGAEGDEARVLAVNAGYEQQIALLERLYAVQTAPGAKLAAFISQTRTALVDLEGLSVRVSQSIGEAIGSSLANGISSLIEGTATAKEVFADFLKSIGQMLVQEGTKMIAMYIAIAIAKAIAGMGGGPTANPTAPGGDWMSAVGRLSPNAKGNAFSSGGVVPYAKGGIVTSPTLFKFADGGTTRNGLMGEAGPEAIMPLQRGADGKLGVQANGLRDAMERDRYNTGSGAPVLNMSFETTNIGGVEYVSRDQLEQAMAETRRSAIRDGAQRGMSMTLDKLQQSPSTRRRIGV